MGRLIRVAEGNTLAIPFSIRQLGVLGTQDVSGADYIVLEVSRPDGTDMEPIACHDNAPGADWAKGIVVALIDVTNVTAKRGTYQAGLTISIDSQLGTRETVTIEVEDRPGYTPPGG